MGSANESSSKQHHLKNTRIQTNNSIFEKQLLTVAIHILVSIRTQETINRNVVLQLLKMLMSENLRQLVFIPPKTAAGESVFASSV